MPGSLGFVAAGLQVGSFLEFVWFQFDVGGLQVVGDVDDVATLPRLLPACVPYATIERSQAPLLLRLADAISSGVINSQLAKERSLRFDVLAVADHDDLHVCGVEIRSGGGHNIFGF